MKLGRWTRMTLAGVVALLAIGGCPSPVSVDTISGSNGNLGAFPAAGASNPTPTNTNDVAGASGVSDRFGQTSGVGTQQDTLAQRFPGCSPALLEAQWKNRIFELVNEERALVGLHPVTLNTTLEAQATEYACEMILYQFFDHVNPVTDSTLSARADQFGYDYYFIGENLAAGQTTPEEAMRDWMNSPGHRANILEPRFIELGVGVRVGGDYGVYWVQEFGEPAD